jgi:hypothetical protein
MLKPFSVLQRVNLDRVRVSVGELADRAPFPGLTTEAEAEG